jgi:lysophospholipase L1-like esterase
VSRHRRLSRLGLGLLVAVVVFFVSGELLARVLGIVDRLNGYTRQLFVRGPSADLPYRLRPGLETALFGIPVRVNQLGFRGPDITTPPGAGVRRVVVLGDSVVFGQGVREDETVAARLARRLAATGTERVEVWNAGVQGYDTVAQAALLESVVLGLHPAVVVVGMSLNDYDPAPAYDPTGVLTRRPPGEAPAVLERSEFLLLLRWAVAFARGRLYTQMLEAAPAAPPAPVTAGGAPHPLDRLVAAEHLRFYAAPDPVLWERLEEALAKLGRLARAASVRLLVAIFPESYQVGVAAPDLMPQRKLLALCRAAEVTCLDLQPAFAAAGGTLFQDAQHPSARGHAVAADAIAAALASGTGGEDAP